MDIKVITTCYGKFVDVLGHDVDVQLWAEDWIKERDEYWDIEMYNNGNVQVDGDSICFSGDNGKLYLTVINKSL
jgi:hypothetical protein